MTSSAYRDTSDSDSRGLSDLQVSIFKAWGTLLSFALQDVQNALPDLFGETVEFLNTQWMNQFGYLVIYKCLNFADLLCNKHSFCVFKFQLLFLSKH